MSSELGRTPRPWPENTQPTVQQLADWLIAATEGERLATVERMVLSREEAHRCFVENHASLKDEAAWLRRRSDRYRTAWLSARRRVHPLRFLASYRAMVAAEDLSREQEGAQRGLAADLSALGAESDHGDRREGEGLACTCRGMDEKPGCNHGLEERP